LTADFGFVPLVSLGSTIWEDLNANGEQDPNETPINGATVTLLDSAGVPVSGVAPVVTSGNGEYNFNDLLPGTYRVQVDLTGVPNAADYQPTPIQVTNANNNSNLDSNLDFAQDTVGANTPTDLIHFSAPITLAAGTEPSNESDAVGVGAAAPDNPNQDADDLDASGNMTLDIGFVRPVSVGSTIWNDLNANGIQDAGEPAIVNAQVTLLNPDGTTFDSDPYTAGVQALVVNTNSDGEYNFNELPAGMYRVQANLATATNPNAVTFIPTPVQVANPNNDDNTDSNIDVSVTTPVNVYQSGVVELTSSGEPLLETDPIGAGGPDQPNQGLAIGDDPDASGNMTVDLGFIEPVSLGSTVWLDSNANGVQEPGELPIAGATVTLLDATTGLPVVGVAPVATDPVTGEYNFNNLPAGNYIVQVDLNTSTNFAAGTLDPTPNQVLDPNTDNNSDSNIASNPAANVYTSGVVVLEVGAEPTGEVDVIAGGGTGQPNQTALQPDNNGNMTVDFGFIQSVSLGSTVWEDENGNGIQDAGESPIAGATVTLLDSLGNSIGAPVLTDVDGQYNFNDLPPGSYQVQVDLSTVAGGADLFASPIQQPDPNTDLNTDSNIASNPGGQVYLSGLVALAAGTEPPAETDPIGAGGADQPNQGLTATDEPDLSGNMTVDFGFVRPVSLGSTVWQDVNADGVQDAGEPAIVGATVTLLDAAGVPVPGVAPVVTNADGEYFFNDLPPGDYRVEVDLAAVTSGTDFLPTPVQETDPNTDLNNDSNVDVANSPNAATNQFVSGVIELRSGGEPTGESDQIGTPGADQPGQQPGANPDNSGNMTLDLGFYIPVSIGSYVWQDANGDGVQDATEAPIENAIVALLVDDGTGTFVQASDISGALIANVTTGLDGVYEFTNLPPGDYRVQVTPPTGFVPTPVQNGADDSDTTVADETDSNINTAATGVPAGAFESGTFTLSTNGEPQEADTAVGDDQDGTPGGTADVNGNMTIDFGFIAPVSVGSYIWEDVNGDGLQDAAEPGVESVLVELLVDDGTGTFVPATDLTGAPVGAVTTGPDGLYEFDNLPPGDYIVQITPPVDYLPTAPQSATDDAIENDSNVAASPATGVYQSPLLELRSGDEANEADTQVGDDLDGVAGDISDLSGNATVDFGLVVPVSIGSYVWEDLNVDGIQDPSEPGLPNALVTLLVDDGTGVFGPAIDLAGGPVAPFTTLTDGLYEFDNLPPGNYVVQVTPPVDFVATPNQTPTNDDPLEGDSNIASEPTPGNFNSGVFTLTSGGEPVEADAQAGDSQDGASGSLQDLSGNTTVDFGFVASLSIGSFVWEDLNADGIQDSNEAPLAGGTVTLLVDDGSGVFGPAIDILGATVAPATVGPDGLYEFDNLPVGDYKIQIAPVGNVFPSPVQNAANNDDTENDSNIASEPSPGVYESGVFSLSSGDEPNEAGPDANRGDNQDGVPGGNDDLNGNMTVDFGFVPPASLGNYVWLDLDMDGVQDANEDGIAGVTVNLYADTDGDGVISGAELTTPVASATTGPNGEYLFPSLEPGVVYQTGVDVTTLPTGLVQTFDEGDGVGATDSLSDPIVLDPNEFHDTADFGYAPPAGLGAVGDTIWIDADDDGVQDPGEPGIVGVTVTITPAPDVDLGAGPGNPISTVTDANGKYLFPNLPLDETYIVEVDPSTLPAGYGPGQQRWL